MLDFSNITGIQIPEGDVKSLQIESKDAWQVYSGTEGLEYTRSADGTQYSCTGLGTATDENIVIADDLYGIPVTSISKHAFVYAPIKTVKIGKRVKTIENHAFVYCDNLTKIEISESVTDIGVSAYSSCVSMTDIDVDSKNETYASVNGVLYNKSMSKIIRYPSGKTDEIFNMPNSVTKIGKTAFDSCYSLKTITVPYKQIREIEDYAFYHCENLQSVDDILSAAESIGYGAFMNCYSITSARISIDAGYAHIGESAFEHCTGLKTIILGLYTLSIGNFAFYDCSELQSIKYNGTMTDWSRIEKGDSWAANTKVVSVVCSNGYVSV